MYTSVDQVPARRQWEQNSWPNQPFNCGPTCVSWEADYYRDALFGIEETRNLATLRDGDGTSAEEQAVMLARRGVPCHVEQPTIAQLKAHLNTRPVVIGMDMSKVPDNIRGHTFKGIHATVGRKNIVVGGVSGVDIMDPNFGFGHAVDSTNGHRFYPDNVIAAARLVNGIWRRTVVPNNAKAGADNMAVQAPEIVFLGPDGKPALRGVGLAAGKHRGYHLDGTGKDFTFATATSAGARGRASITGRPDAPVGQPFLTMMNGVFTTGAPWYLFEDGVKVKANPDPPIIGDPAALKKAQSAAASDIAQYAKEKYP